MSITEDLFYGDYKGCELPPAEQEALRQATARLEEYTADFCRTLSEAQQQTFHQLRNMAEEIATREKLGCYQNGLTAGLHLAAETDRPQ
ncbi:MAG: hypothetical protein IJ168_01175 [Eubacterium sp.]|nr:hypothetical protein [Eubacterium sp.]